MRLVTMLAAATLLLGTPPAATAAPRRTVLTDGFTMRGTAGDQAVVRVPHTLKIPYRADDITLTAGAGAFAGFALVRHGVAQPSGPRFAYRVASTPLWTCGRTTCDGELGHTYGSELPKGDYVLVLLGERGAKVHVTVDPAARGRRPAVVTPTARSTPHVAPADGAVADLAAEPYAFGDFDLPGSGAGVVGLLHTVDMTAVESTGVDFGVGWGSLASCDQRRWSGSRGGDLGIGYRTTAIAAPSDAGTTVTCGSWEGTALGVATQRALGFYVPLVAR